MKEPTKAQIAAFQKERAEALLSLDKYKILAYCKKYGARIVPPDGTPEKDLPFWGAIHKAIILLREATPEQVKNSEEWLVRHGMKPDYFGVTREQFLAEMDKQKRGD